MVVLGNGDDKNYCEELRSYCLEKNFLFVNFSVDFELEFQKEGLTVESLVPLFELCFKELGVGFFFTTGQIETRSWQIKDGSNLVEAASKIHNDIAKRLIAAEVTHYDDFLQNKKFEVKGKEYIVQSRDIINFRHNA